MLSDHNRFNKIDIWYKVANSSRFTVYQDEHLYKPPQIIAKTGPRPLSSAWINFNHTNAQ